MESRLDTSRVLVIAFTKLLNRLLEIRYEEVYSGNHSEFLACENFVRAVSAYLLTSGANDLADRQRFGGLHTSMMYRDMAEQGSESNLLGTLGMEAVFVMTVLLQRREYLFTKERVPADVRVTARIVDTSSRPSRVEQSPKERFIGNSAVNLLVDIKRPLHSYLKSLFREAGRSGSKLGQHLKL